MQHTTNTIDKKNTSDGQDTWWALAELATIGPMPDYKNIKIYEETHERLKSHGNMDESFDDLINRILDDWEDNETNDG